MLLIASFLLTTPLQEIHTGGDLYPLTVVDILYSYTCNETNYKIQLTVKDVSRPEISSLVVGDLNSTNPTFAHFKSAISHYRSIFSWNASCRVSGDDLILFVRGFLQSDLDEDDERNHLTVFNISSDGSIKIQYK